MATYILQDLNVRDSFVSPSTEFLLYDSKVVVQSVWRLLTTQVGEIPNFRSYGLDLKRFTQYPLTPETIDFIFNYVKNTLKRFETRAEIIHATIDFSLEQGTIDMVFFLRIKSTGEEVKLPTWTVQVSTI